jgi:H+/Cl- antiporter ClcA
MTVTHLLYLHGFRSSPLSAKAVKMAAAVQASHPAVHWWCPQLPPSPRQAMAMLMAGIAGGFGSVFGTPAAGFVFGMEVQALGRIRYEGLVPCLVAACVGDLVARALGVLESPAVEDALLAVFDLMVERTLRSRGAHLVEAR